MICFSGGVKSPCLQSYFMALPSASVPSLAPFLTSKIFLIIPSHSLEAEQRNNTRLKPEAA